jgi:PAS domain S-box-containing protein
MTGYSADELIGTAPPYPYWPADIPENDIQLFHENMAWGAEGKEGRFIRKNGEEFWVRINDTPVKMNGNTDYILTNWIDITATKKAEQSLRESEAFNAGLLEASPYPIYVIDPDLAIMYVNPAMEKLTGFSAEELTGKKPPYPYWGNDLPKDAEDLLHNAMANGVTGLEQRFVNKKGEEFWVRLANSPIQRGGKTGYLLTTWVDITETKKTEQLLRQSEAFNASLINASPNPMNAINLTGQSVMSTLRSKN